MSDRQRILFRFWQHVASQNAETLREYFTADAEVRWHNSNECFTVSEYIRANCEYPGNWKGEVEQMELHPDGQRAMTITRVWSKDESILCRVVSFFAFAGEKIACMDEFWADITPAPDWRQTMCIGKPIYKKETKE